MDDRLDKVDELCQQAVFGGAVGGLAEADSLLDTVEADLCLARGRVLHGRFLGSASAASVTGETPGDGGQSMERNLFERAAELYRRVGDVRGEGTALFWLGTFHQVVEHDDAAAVPVLERARQLASRADDHMTMAYALRHLGIAAHRAGRLDEARGFLEQSTALRRDLAFWPGVAANLVGLAYVAAGDGRAAQVPAILGEAEALADQTDAAAISRQIAEARANIGV